MNIYTVLKNNMEVGMRTIIVKELTKMAMTETAGMKLRDKIEEVLKNDSKVVLDFSGISLFATMFFNASIGHFVLNLSPEKCEEIFVIENISELGKDTYYHSFENAKMIYNNKSKENLIGDITQDNIEQS